jgi:hypothetical protein
MNTVQNSVDSFYIELFLRALMITLVSLLQPLIESKAALMAFPRAFAGKTSVTVMRVERLLVVC